MIWLVLISLAIYSKIIKQINDNVLLKNKKKNNDTINWWISYLYQRNGFLRY